MPDDEMTLCQGTGGVTPGDKNLRAETMRLIAMIHEAVVYLDQRGGSILACPAALRHGLWEGYMTAGEKAG